MKEIRPHLEGIATLFVMLGNQESSEGNQTSFRRDCDLSINPTSVGYVKKEIRPHLEGIATPFI